MFETAKCRVKSKMATNHHLEIMTTSYDVCKYHWTPQTGVKTLPISSNDLKVSNYAHFGGVFLGTGNLIPSPNKSSTTNQPQRVTPTAPTSVVSSSVSRLWSGTMSGNFSACDETLTDRTDTRRFLALLSQKKQLLSPDHLWRRL